MNRYRFQNFAGTFTFAVAEATTFDEAIAKVFTGPVSFLAHLTTGRLYVDSRGIRFRVVVGDYK